MQSTTISDVATLAHLGISCLASFTPPLESSIVDHSHTLLVNSHYFSHLSATTSSITFAYVSFKFVTGIGTVHPISSISLSNVYHIRGVPFNLLSIRQLTKTLNCSIAFFPTSCVFKDLKMEGDRWGHECD